MRVDRRHLALCLQAKPACDCFPQQLAIVGRDPKQLSHPPDEVRLELVHHEVSHGDFPQHLDDLLAAILVELGAKDASEPVKIDGGVVADYRLANEPARFIVAKPEMRLQQSIELAALFVGNLSVDCQGVDEQRCCGQPQFLLAQIPRVRSRVSEALEKLRECRPRCHLALRQLPLRFGEPPIAQTDAYRDLAPRRS
jgi:hypothetical protein